MPTPFQHAVAELCQSLSLQPPEQIDNALFTLQVGEHALHLSEQPAHQLLMFCCLS
ncbi:type III secretion protein, partial [Pseudomonas sp. MWU13-2860]